MERRAGNQHEGFEELRYTPQSTEDLGNRRGDKDLKGRKGKAEPEPNTKGLKSGNQWH